MYMALLECHNRVWHEHGTPGVPGHSEVHIGEAYV
jgi:hypothetical protein